MYDTKNMNIWKMGSQTQWQTVGNRTKIITRNKVAYPILCRRDFMDADISVLNLSVRSYNGLRRAGWAKVEDLIYNIESEQDLFRIRNMGKKSVEEVITKLIEYYLSLLSSGEKVTFRQNFNLANGLDINTGIQK